MHSLSSFPPYHFFTFSVLFHFDHRVLFLAMLTTDRTNADEISRYYDCLNGGMMVGDESQVPQLIRQQSNGYRLNGSAAISAAMSRGQLKEYWQSNQWRRHYRDSDCDSGIFSVAGDAMTSSTSNDSSLDAHVLPEPEPEMLFNSYRQRSGSWP